MTAPSAPSPPARDLVLRYGWNTTAYQILNPGIEHWFAPAAPAVVGFVRQPGRWIAAGAPVCDRADLHAIAGQFEADAAEHGSRVCYFAAMDRLRHALDGGRDAHASIAIGAQPVWDPADWPDIVRRRRPSLRAQLNRARNKGVRVTPVSDVARADLDPLRQCLDRWLATRTFPAMHFLVEPNTLDGPVDDRLLYVAAREGDGGRPLGFLLASPVPLRQGYLFEQVVRCPAAPNGTAELLIDAAMRDLAARGCGYVTQGLVALSKQARDAMADNPLWIRALFAWARAHGNRFYNFRGIEAFREKMQPRRWETIYAITNEPRFTPRTLYASARAFCQSSPATALTRALARALRQETRWLFSHRDAHPPPSGPTRAGVLSRKAVRRPPPY